MSLGFGHLIGAWVLGKTWEGWQQKRLNRVTWFCLLLAGILPDIDNLIDWRFSLEVHRTFTHSFLFALFMGLLFYLVFSFFKRNGRKKYAQEIYPLTIGFAFFLGISMHLFLDLFALPGVPLLWPLSYYFGINGIMTLTGTVTSDFNFVFPRDFFIFILDMSLGIGWLLWFVVRGRLRP